MIKFKTNKTFIKRPRKKRMKRIKTEFKNIIYINLN